MKNFLIKLLGGMTKAMHAKACIEKIDNIKNKLYEPEQEEFKVGDEIWFYYVSRIDYQMSCYYKALISEIKTIDNGEKISKSYVIDTSNLQKRFNYNFSVSENHISKSKINLRNKIVNSDSWTFLTFMSYDEIETENKY